MPPGGLVLAGVPCGEEYNDFWRWCNLARLSGPFRPFSLPSREYSAWTPASPHGYIGRAFGALTALVVFKRCYGTAAPFKAIVIVRGRCPP